MVQLPFEGRAEAGRLLAAELVTGTLILLTGLAGYVFGFLLGAIWNAAAGKGEES